MKYSKLFLTLINLLFFFFGQAQHVNELHYKAIASKSGKTQGGFDFWFGKEFLKIQSNPIHDRNPARYIDKPNNLLVMDFENRKEYIIESLDSVYELNAEIENTGEKQVINGYNCERYNYKESVRFSYSSNLSALSITPTAKTILYAVSFWITRDLVADEAYSVYIAHTLFGGIATFNFPGVIVKLENTVPKAKPGPYDGYTILDKAVTDTELAKDFERPWKKYDKPVALLPFEGGDSYALTIPYTEESTKEQNKRMKALLIKVTGIESPKWKGGFEGIRF